MSCQSVNPAAAAPTAPASPKATAVSAATLVLTTCAHGVQSIERDCHCPCANRYVGKNHVKRVSDPRSMKEVLYLPPTSEPEGFVNKLL